MNRDSKGRFTSVPKNDNEKVLVIRTSNHKNQGYGGFQWPRSGYVSCNNWNPKPICGYGLHGLLWGEGNAILFLHSTTAIWSIVEVNAKDIVKIDEDKVKFPFGNVVYCGSKNGAFEYLYKRTSLGHLICGGTIKRMKEDSTVILGNYSKAITGVRGRSIVGKKGIAISGKEGISQGGYRSLLKSGKKGILIGAYSSCNDIKIAIAYIGKDRILPNIFYKVDCNGSFYKQDDE
jgi:hypothetical protein